MKGKKKKVDPPYESVKIRVEIVELVRQHKKETRLPIGAFFELASEEKLKKEKSK
jgi:hypothetical protein